MLIIKKNKKRKHTERRACHIQQRGAHSSTSCLRLSRIAVDVRNVRYFDISKKNFRYSCMYIETFDIPICASKCSILRYIEPFETMSQHYSSTNRTDHDLHTVHHLDLKPTLRGVVQDLCSTGQTQETCATSTSCSLCGFPPDNTRRIIHIRNMPAP